MARKQPTPAASAAPAKSSAMPAAQSGAKAAPSLQDAADPATAKQPAATKPAPGPRGGKSAAEAREDLLARAAQNTLGAFHLRSDPLADAQAAQGVIEFISGHKKELLRRGLAASYSEAALLLAAEIEENLQALPAAAVAARGRSPESAELLADAAATAHSVRDAVWRVTRGPNGRKAAHAFGLGQPFSARQASHVLHALQQISAGAKSHPEVATDVGLLADDLTTMQDLAGDVARLPGAGSPLTDAHLKLFEAQGALRAFFDLVASKATLAFAGDPEERARFLSLLPRAEDRRQLRRQIKATPAA